MKFFAILLLFLVSCTEPSKENDNIPLPPQEDEADATVVGEITDLKKEIQKIVGQSDCSDYFWKNRGKAPSGYMQGMALMYAKQVCSKGSDFITSSKPSGVNSLGNKYEDALNHYDIEGSQLNTYTFLIGLGMRESSGSYCEGRDVTADWTNHQSAEAGTFQMSYVSRVFNKELEPLYQKYKKGELDCELNTFKEGVKCSKQDFKNFGNGEGTKWQELVKKCPALSAQWAAILIRSQYRHFGPIIRKEVEFKNECRKMLEKVGEAAEKGCSQLN